jgi:hypothetical protein
LIKGAANKAAFDKEFDPRSLLVGAGTGVAGRAFGSTRTTDLETGEAVESIGASISIGTAKGTMSAGAKSVAP